MIEMFKNQDEHEKHYTKILWILLTVFFISVLGSDRNLVGPDALNFPGWLIQAIVFGVALVKGYYVIRYFMHLPREAGFLIASVASPLVLLGIFLILMWPDFGYVGTDMSTLK